MHTLHTHPHTTHTLTHHTHTHTHIHMPVGKTWRTRTKGTTWTPGYTSKSFLYIVLQGSGCHLARITLFLPPTQGAPGDPGDNGNPGIVGSRVREIYGSNHGN